MLMETSKQRSKKAILDTQTYCIHSGILPNKFYDMV